MEHEGAIAIALTNITLTDFSDARGMSLRRILSARLPTAAAGAPVPARARWRRPPRRVPPDAPGRPAAGRCIDVAAGPRYVARDHRWFSNFLFAFHRLNCPQSRNLLQITKTSTSCSTRKRRPPQPPPPQQPRSLRPRWTLPWRQQPRRATPSPTWTRLRAGAAATAPTRRSQGPDKGRILVTSQCFLDLASRRRRRCDVMSIRTFFPLKSVSSSQRSSVYVQSGRCPLCLWCRRPCTRPYYFYVFREMWKNK